MRLNAKTQRPRWAGSFNRIAALAGQGLRRFGGGAVEGGKVSGSQIGTVNLRKLEPQIAQILTDFGKRKHEGRKAKGLGRVANHG